MKKVIWIVGTVVLLASGLLTLWLPGAMLSPGELIRGHKNIGNDCFACHQLFAGASGDKCMVCHKLAEIGVVTTVGTALPSVRKIKVPFHQQLSTQQCVQCHTDHAGAEAKTTAVRFSHDLIAVAAREQCANCHEKPLDTLHRQIAGNCQPCHTTAGWRPATVDHDKYFRFDRHHRTDCVTCHVGGDYTKYTCYGCHEHTPARIEREHREEGIRDFQNCVKCHRSGEEHEGRGERR